MNETSRISSPSSRIDTGVRQHMPVLVFSSPRYRLHHNELTAHGSKTTGEISGFHTTGNGTGSGTQSPLFRTADYTYVVAGIDHRGISLIGRDDYFRLKDGDTVTVTYLPDYPALSETSLGPRVDGGQTLLLAAAIISAAVAFCMALKAKVDEYAE